MSKGDPIMGKGLSLTILHDGWPRVVLESVANDVA